MVDFFESINKVAQSDYIKGVYSCTGSGDMEGLLDDVAITRFPCVMAEVGDDGFFNMLNSCDDCRTLTFYVLESNQTATSMQIREILHRAKRAGIEMLRKIRQSGREFGDEWFGVDFARIDYFKVGPLGYGAYGYCFNLTIVEYGN